MYKKILVPLDGSRFSNRALKYAVDLAQQYKASLLLVQVVEPVRPIPPVDPTGLTSPEESKFFIAKGAPEEILKVSSFCIATVPRPRLPPRSPSTRLPAPIAAI